MTKLKNKIWIALLGFVMAVAAVCGVGLLRYSSVVRLALAYFIEIFSLKSRQRNYSAFFSMI